jgi:hypothetical protein
MLQSPISTELNKKWITKAATPIYLTGLKFEDRRGCVSFFGKKINFGPFLVKIALFDIFQKRPFFNFFNFFSKF